MIEALKERWTIVIPGRWNEAIFNPGWLGKNVFESKDIGLEVGIESGLPRRITGDNVTLIPSNSNLMLAPRNLEEETLSRMEQIACKVLDILRHTPIRSIGINYGYKVSPLPAEITDKLPSLLSTELASEGLIVKTRTYKWSLNYEDRKLNIECRLGSDDAIISFNFSATAKDAEEAAKCVVGKVMPFRNKTKSILTNVFGVELEE